MTNKFRVWGGRERLYFVYSDLFEGTSDEWFTDLTIQPDGSRHIIEKSDVVMVQWFTGLKDKNRKEIYEGDIVEWDEQRCEVKWYAGMFVIEPFMKPTYGPMPLSYCVDSDVEIIGNIYENPELLSENRKE